MGRKVSDSSMMGSGTAALISRFFIEAHSLARRMGFLCEMAGFASELQNEGRENDGKTNAKKDECVGVQMSVCC